MDHKRNELITEELTNNIHSRIRTTVEKKLPATCLSNFRMKQIIFNVIKSGRLKLAGLVVRMDENEIT